MAGKKSIPPGKRENPKNPPHTTPPLKPAKKQPPHKTIPPKKGR